MDHPKPKPWHAQPLSQVYETLHSSEDGLRDAEATERLQTHGPNTLRAKPPKSILRMLKEQLLDPMVEAKYILTPVLWKYLYRYAKKHQARGNGFGYGMVYPNNPQSVTRTLSARYYKDGAEILIDRGWDMATGEKDFDDPLNQQHRPRRLTPRECARLMGFEAPGEAKFRIPVSDTQAYRQFGNSVVVPVFAAVAKLLEPKIKQAVALRQQEAQHGRRSR